MTAQSGCGDFNSMSEPTVARLTGVARINRTMGAIGAVGVVATAESSCMGGLIRSCSAQHRAEHTSSAQRHITDFDLLGLCECAGGGEANLAAGEAAGRCVRPTGERCCPRIRWLGGQSRR